MSDVDRVEAALRLAAREPERLLVVVGPTASGKSALAMQLAARIGGEIVSADSVQIVRGFDIGSGKPTAEDRAAIPHHLLDAVDPMDDIDASRFTVMADAAIANVRARGKRPIVCGGTFLWVRALLYGLVEAPPADRALREAHRDIVARQGRGVLHGMLAAVDPAAAQRLHPNDVVRVSRALEVFETSGQRMSDLQATHGFRESRIPAQILAIERSPDELTRRIGARVTEMLEAGWVAETHALLARGFGEARAMSSVGYREVAAHLRGEIAEGALPEAIVRSTRIYARRQRTFLKQADIAWL